MKPREFVDVYGLPVATLRIVDAGLSLVVPRNDDRYYLEFFWTDNSFNIIPEVLQATVSTGRVLAPNTGNFKYTHAIDGALVNMAWRCRATVPGARLVTIEAFMLVTTVDDPTYKPVPLPPDPPRGPLLPWIPPAANIEPLPLPPLPPPPTVPPVPGRYKQFLRSAPAPNQAEHDLAAAQGYYLGYEPGVGWWRIPIGQLPGW